MESIKESLNGNCMIMISNNIDWKFYTIQNRIFDVPMNRDAWQKTRASSRNA